jgi:TolA-binding protein
MVYAMAKSGDVVAARAELAKLDALVRPHPLVPNLASFLDRVLAKPGGDGGLSTASATRTEPPAPAQAQAGPVPAAAATPVAANGGGGDAVPGDPRVAMETASQAIRKGDWDRARQVYSGIVTRNPSDSEALCGLGDVARAQGDTASAISTYKRAISVNPSYLPALLGVADTEWMTGDHAGAMRGYKDIVDRFPEGTYPGYVKQRVDSPPAVASPAAASSGAKPAPAKAASPSTTANEPTE